MSQFLDRLAQQVTTAIPLARHLDFRYLDFDGIQLHVTAPLGPNINDKGTFFAGSQAALLTLAGWSLTTLLAWQAGVAVDVVAVESHIDYVAPLSSDANIVALVVPEECERFTRSLQTRRRAPLRVTVELGSVDNVLASSFSGRYLARKPVENQS